MTSEDLEVRITEIWDTLVSLGLTHTQTLLVNEVCAAYYSLGKNDAVEEIAALTEAK